MKIAIEDIKQWQEWRSLWNTTPLEEIEFTLGGELIDIEVTEKVWESQDGSEPKIRPVTKEQFKFWGLANVDYLLMAVESLKVTKSS